MNAKEEIANSTINVFKGLLQKSLEGIQDDSLNIPSEYDVSDIEDQLFADSFLGELCAAQPELASLHAYIIYWYIKSHDFSSRNALTQTHLDVSEFKQWLLNTKGIPVYTISLFNYVFEKKSDTFYNCEDKITTNTLFQFYNNFLKASILKPNKFLKGYPNKSVDYIKNAICKDSQINYLSQFFPSLTLLLSYFIKWSSQYTIHTLMISKLVINQFNNWLKAQSGVSKDVIKMHNLMVHLLRSVGL